MATVLNPPWRILWITAIILLSMNCIDSAAVPIVNKVIPYDAPKGYLVANLTIADISDSPFLLGHSDGYLPFFKLTKDGKLITKRSLESLSGLTFDLSVDSVVSYPKSNWRFRINVSRFIIKFPRELYVGQLAYQSPQQTVPGLEDIHAVVLDEDGLMDHHEQIFYHLEPRTDFVIGQSINFGIVRIESIHSMDQTSRTDYDLTLVARLGNGLEARTLIKVLLIPVLEKVKYEVMIDDNMDSSEEVLTIHGYYPNIHQLHYRIKELNDHFEINHDTGMITRKRNGSLEQGFYIFHVVAESFDARVSARVSDHSLVMVSVLPSDGSFDADKFIDPQSDSKSHQLLKRNTRSLVRSVTEGASGSLFSLSNNTGGIDLHRFAFTDQNGLPIPAEFEVNVNTGMVSLKNGAKLDYETKKESNMDVRVTRQSDGVEVETIRVRVTIIDTNDEPPKFDNVPAEMIATVDYSALQGSKVYQLQASDPDKGARIQYYIISGDQGRFKCDPEFGIITTLGNGFNTNGQKFTLAVRASDVSANPVQSVTKALTIFAGEHEPQFFQKSYYVKLPERSPMNKVIASCQAKSFQDQPITYSLSMSGSQASKDFKIDPTTGNVTSLRSSNDPFLYNADPRVFNLQCTATEGGSFRPTTVPLTIEITDINDYRPEFSLVQYIQDDVMEDTPIGQTVLIVSAADYDGPDNGQITYTVSDAHFDIVSENNRGSVRVKQPLDFDRQPHHRYILNITATDNGTPPLSSQTKAEIIVKNVNDEKPEFPEAVMRRQISETAREGTVITRVKATDPDGPGSGITYEFKGGKKDVDIFTIEPYTGNVILRQKIGDNGKALYTLDLVAIDDGRCSQCGNTVGPKLQGEAKLIVEVMDTNNNRPEFTECSTYKPVVMENSPPGTSVIKVGATDGDTGSNAKLTYEIIYSPHDDKNFQINNETGLITTLKMFDREREEKSYRITVKARDHGTNRLEGFCNIEVVIGDNNDNVPRFSSAVENIPVYSDHDIQRPVWTSLRAEDSDAGENATVEYFLVEQNYTDVSVRKADGFIFLNRNRMIPGTVIKLVIEARDRGPVKPLQPWRRIDVYLRVVERGTVPIWKELPPEVTFAENALLNTQIARIRAETPGDPTPIAYAITAVNGIPMPPEDPKIQEPFILRKIEGSDEIGIHTYLNMDYEDTPVYLLKLEASSSGSRNLRNETIIKVQLFDRNDRAPRFLGGSSGRTLYIGAVGENQPPPQRVLTVSAMDRDTRPDFKKVTYSIDQKSSVDAEAFEINSETGEIRSKRTFDREEQARYMFEVIAHDGFKSDLIGVEGHNAGRAQVQVIIADQNDESPRFKERIYKGSVMEDAAIGHVVMTVTAEDKDTIGTLIYDIAGSTFGVRETTGEIYVAEQLDYEGPKQRYELDYIVFDGINRNFTKVEISVGNINDNAPEFENGIYVISNVTDEMEPVPNPPGRFLLQVKANDADAQNSVIQYELSGDRAQEYFSINRQTGKIYQIKTIDREAPNNEARVWEFNVIARDLKQSGYAIVKVNVQDINDNKPVFDPETLIGYVDENSAIDIPVMTVVAKDADNGINATVVYNIMNQSPGEKFKLVNVEIGTIYTAVSNLDRESHDRYMVIVHAQDKGNPRMMSTATATIYVRDVNDNDPKFERDAYDVTVREHLPNGATVLTVSANDLDSSSRGNLKFSPVGDWGPFMIENIFVTDSGLIVVGDSRRLDYEDPNSRFYNLQVKVSDGSREDMATIRITVLDVNDNKPLFQSNISYTVSEGAPVGTELGQFTATDADSGDNAVVSYRISRESDPYDNINIDQNGYVSIRPNQLDREKWPIDGDEDGVMKVTVLAVDRGAPPQTGSATLTLKITDINDNYPHFARTYNPVVYENEVRGKEVVRFSATDPDSSKNGPPFYFRFPGDNLDFSLAQPAENLGIINTRRTFDREKQKYYPVHVVMADRLSLSGTNTMTVTIGDRNDNDHFSGHKEIMVYNYEGKFRETYIGYVYAADLDDWDKGDKKFTMLGRPLRYFRLNETNGDLYLVTYLPEGIHNMTVEVEDVVRNKKVESTVTVRSVNIGEEPVMNAGSFRLMDISCEEFIHRTKVNPTDHSDTTSYNPSAYDNFRVLIAQSLGTRTEYVDMFTCKDCADIKDSKCLDVRYMAHGSPNYQPARLNAAFDMNRDAFDTLLKKTKPTASVAQVPVDLCLREDCESGCTNRLVITKTPHVTNTNATSLVGVDSYIVAECTCKANTFRPEDSQCSAVSCYNGGTCTQETNGYSCSCPGGFSGPRCQLTKRHFNGNGWAMYPALTQCHQSVTSVEFATQSADGLILYNGPLRDLLPGEPTDFIALQLENGYPRLFVNHGSGTSDMSLDGKDANGNRIINNINDGRWHRIDIYRVGKRVRMVLDHCKEPQIIEKADSKQDRRPCEVAMETPGINEFINVNQPLQLGGRQTPKNLAFQQGLLPQGLNGCIRNFEHDGKLYDLAIGQSGLHKNSYDGCPPEEAQCRKDNLPVCGRNGECESSLAGQLSTGVPYRCICHQGWRGDTCNQRTTVVNFKSDSFIEWEFKQNFFIRLDPVISNIHVKFRTRQDSGVIMYLEGQATSAEFLMLRINNQRLEFYYNLGTEIQELSLSHVNVSDGAWHLVRIERTLRTVILRMDIGEGRLFNYTTGGVRSHKVLQLSSKATAGAKVHYSGEQPVSRDDLSDSCLDDPRYNNAWLPVTLGETSQSEAARIKIIRNVEERCYSDACRGVTCNSPFICVDLWRHAECRCPDGMEAGWNNKTNPPIWSCLPIDECLYQPCVHGTCIDQTPGFKCHCETGWKGDICADKSEQEFYAATISPYAMGVIIVCIFTVLLLVILFVVCSRKTTPDDKFILQIDPDDEIRENIVDYDEEGAGEEDHDGYDINALSKPVNEIPRDMPLRGEPVRPLRSAPPPGDHPDVGDYIGDRMNDADTDPHAPPYDTVHEYNDEGNGSSAGSLSSLNSTNSDNDQDYNYLNDWGPRFSKLADMYGGDDN